MVSVPRLWASVFRLGKPELVQTPLFSNAAIHLGQQELVDRGPLFIL